VTRILTLTTVRRQCPNTGNWITMPAHYVARPRITDSDVREHGGFAKARDVKWGRA